MSGSQNVVQSFFSSVRARIRDYFLGLNSERQGNPALASAAQGLGLAVVTGILTVIGKK